MSLFEKACEEGDLEKVKELYLENNITDGLQIASSCKSSTIFG